MTGYTTSSFKDCTVSSLNSWSMTCNDTPSDWEKNIYQMNQVTNAVWNNMSCRMEKMYMAGCTSYNDYATSASDWETWTIGSGGTVTAPINPRNRLREILQQRLAPSIHCRYRGLQHAKDDRELRARETMKRILGQEKYQQFVKNGFVSVKAKSGRVYVIHPGHGMTDVYERGRKVERLCVVLRGKFPPTDSLLMRYLLVLNDEQDFINSSIKHSVYRSTTVTTHSTPRQLPLLEIFRALKVA